MKMKKGLIVSSLSTAMAVSMVAGIAGTIAWYQFNTRVSTTLIGTNVANSGVLQISKDGTNWGRDLVTADLVGHEIELTPVTFGALNANGSLPGAAYKNGHADSVWDQAENARDAWDPSGYNAYEAAVANTDYVQYTVYIKALEASNTGEAQVAKDVYLTDITFDDVGSGVISSALRAHLAIDTTGDGTEDKFLLVSKDGVTDLNLNGVLDFDNDGIADRKGGAEWVANRDKVTFYGRDGEVQNALSADDLKAAKDGDGNILESEIDKKLFTTLVDKNIKVTVTLWIEGWDNSVAEFQKDDVKVTDVLYRTVNVKPVSTVDEYYVVSGSNYNKASGDAVNGVNYFAITESEINLEDFEAIPAQTYTKSGSNYILANGVAQSGEHYYKLHARDVNDEVITPAELDAQLDGLYEIVNTQYVLSDDDHESFDELKTYYSRINETVNYDLADPNAAPFVDGNSNVLPSNNVNVNKYFVKDSDNNYIKVSEFNVKGETYYGLEATAYNPLLNTYADGSYSVAGLYVENPAHALDPSDPGYSDEAYIAAAGTNVQATSYFLDDAGTPAVSFNDLPDGAIADVEALELHTLSSGVYAPATGASVHGVNYYTVDETENPLLSSFADDLFNVEKFYVENPAHASDPEAPEYILATGNNEQGTAYYLDNAGANEARLNDLFVLSGEQDLNGFGLYVKDSGNAYVPVGLGNVLGKDYYTFRDGGTIDNVPMWTGLNTDNATFHFGLTFDVGHDAFKN